MLWPTHSLTRSKRTTGFSSRGTCQAPVPGPASAPWGQDAHMRGQCLRHCDLPLAALTDGLRPTAASPAGSCFEENGSLRTHSAPRNPVALCQKLLCRSFLPMFTQQLLSELYPEEGEQDGNAMKKSRLGIPVMHQRQPLLLSGWACREAGERWPSAGLGVKQGTVLSPNILQPSDRAGWLPAISAHLLFAFPALSCYYCCLRQGLRKHESPSAQIRSRIQLSHSFMHYHCQHPWVCTSSWRLPDAWEMSWTGSIACLKNQWKLPWNETFECQVY